MSSLYGIASIAGALAVPWLLRKGRYFLCEDRGNGYDCVARGYLTPRAACTNGRSLFATAEDYQESDNAPFQGESISILENTGSGWRIVGEVMDDGSCRQENFLSVNEPRSFNIPPVPIFRRRRF